MTGATGAADLEVAIIARDAERTLGRTLASVRGIARRVVVVDSGSTDGTIDLCRQHGAEVIEQPWLGYVKQKQLALERCNATWVLSLDSDESLDDGAREAVRGAVEGNDPAAAGYAINRRVRIGDIELRHTWQPEWRTRLVRREKARWAGYDPHDRLDVDGLVSRLPGTILHDSFADVSEMLRKAVVHGAKAAESYFEMGRGGSLLRLVVSPVAAVLKQLVLKGAWRDGWIGWVAAFSGGVHNAAKQMRLMELRHRGR
jgi:glycosyltransferase involved in cell wall biosynthesis